MKAALKNGVDKGVLVQVKNSYKLSADAKKASTKKPAAAAEKPKAKAKAAAPKKATAKAAPKKVSVYHYCCYHASVDECRPTLFISSPLEICSKEEGSSSTHKSKYFPVNFMSSIDLSQLVISNILHPIRPSRRNRLPRRRQLLPRRRRQPPRRKPPLPRRRRPRLLRSNLLACEEKSLAAHYYISLFRMGRLSHQLVSSYLNPWLTRGKWVLYYYLQILPSICITIELK